MNNLPRVKTIELEKQLTKRKEKMGPAEVQVRTEGGLVRKATRR
jgi:hypothetical protein